jgi:hypothetical protein
LDRKYEGTLARPTSLLPAELTPFREGRASSSRGHYTKWHPQSPCPEVLGRSCLYVVFRSQGSKGRATRRFYAVIPSRGKAQISGMCPPTTTFWAAKCYKPISGPSAAPPPDRPLPVPPRHSAPAFVCFGPPRLGWVVSGSSRLCLPPL